MNERKLEAIKSHLKVTNLRIEKTTASQDGYYLWTMYARNQKLATVVTTDDLLLKTSAELVDKAYNELFPQTTVYEV